MSCLFYFSNFFNDHTFKVAQFAPLVAPVLRICNRLVLLASQSGEELTQQLIVINETLEVYRFIVERYAAYNSPEVLAGD